MIYLKQSTASQSVLIGPFVDDTDGATPETGLSIANTDIRLSANGGNMAAKNSGGATHDEAGLYSITLDATDTATVGRLQLSVKVTGALYVFHDFQVLEEAIYDSLIGSGATGDLGVDVVSISGDSGAADNLELQYDGTGLTGDNFPANQQQVGNISVGAGGLSVDATSFTLTTGTESSGTVSNTEELDGVLHTITPSASEIDCYYEFDVGTNGSATEAIWDGYVGNNADAVEVYGYDWISTSYKQIGTIDGKNADTNEEQAYILTKAMTGTGANVGLVRVKFGSSGGDVAVDLNTDRILCEYTSIAAERLILHSGLAQAGTSNTVTLDSGANATDDYYKHARILVAGGTGLEQERIVVDYVGSTRVATIAPPWVTNPDTTSVLEVLPGLAHAETNSKTVKVGLAQAATSSSITLATDASSVDDYYNDDVVIIDAGTGEGQERIITDYNGTTKVASIVPDWITTPDTTSEYIVEEALTVTGLIEAAPLAAVADEVLDEALSGHNTAGTLGKAVRQMKEGLISEESSVNDAGATDTSFITNLTEASDDHYNDLTMVFTSGALTGQSRVIADYNGTTKTVTFDEAWTEAPADADDFIIKTDHIHTKTQIATEVWSASGRALSDPAGFKKNTAADITFVLRDSSDGRTPIASETVTAQRSIDGAAFGACANSVTEIGNGAYIITLAAADLNGDIAILRFTSTNSDDLLITIKTET